MPLNPALLWYRRMFKVMHIKFSGDSEALKAFSYAFKMETRSNKDEKDPLKIAKFIFDGDTAREWLLTEMYRADLQQDGKYRLKLTKDQYSGPKLRPVAHPEYFEIKLAPELVLSSRAGKDTL
mmetsp:Transcript_4934/g.9247  ORF Transcript_4934/g.9247 Transcript_4934/m.9247 type:complete len:123 (-) Transcript_4934:1706-2074(-)|eukprot:CAMPEP_0204911630 /NCGR_PEP_ID=MMETSP1397-20131031/9933_1 /ASSEMBLY_ACC=CAM_ASM_000891 /TAXON_ID=49980 /ORGANISM="Climacostomum Climacostomum virens, Strain Stock W-24" /LENGTH=122 /DNA_ID=CAMNT_0052082245 /DNA_START=118 /DNA_END=486 /DNA_ORIENTATION=+